MNIRYQPPALSGYSELSITVHDYSFDLKTTSLLSGIPVRIIYSRIDVGVFQFGLRTPGRRRHAFNLLDVLALAIVQEATERGGMGAADATRLAEQAIEVAKANGAFGPDGIVRFPPDPARPEVSLFLALVGGGVVGAVSMRSDSTVAPTVRPIGDASATLLRHCVISIPVTALLDDLLRRLAAFMGGVEVDADQHDNLATADAEQTEPVPCFS